MIDEILDLYKKHARDLKKVRHRIAKLKKLKGNAFNPYMDDVESEIVYLLFKKNKPKNVVEISPCDGWSTSWILNGLKDNDCGNLVSFDIIDNSLQNIPDKLSSGRWKFVKGYVQKNFHYIPDNIDFLFIDSDHSAKFCSWYIKNVFPKLKKNALVATHDIFHYSDEPWQFNEKHVLLKWLKTKSISYTTFSPVVSTGIGNYKKVVELRATLGISKMQIFSQHFCNPMIFYKINNKT